MAIKFVLGPLHQMVAFVPFDGNKEGDKMLCQIAYGHELYFAEYEKRSSTHYTWTGVTHLACWQTMVGRV